MSMNSTKRSASRKRPCSCFLAEHRSEDRVWRHKNGRIAAVYGSSKTGTEKFESHYPNGQLHTTGSMKNDHPVGEWHTYGLGKHYVYTYDDFGKLVQTCCYPMTDGKTSIVPSKNTRLMPEARGAQKVRV